jgi:hemolysin activation/secretion protein
LKHEGLMKSHAFLCLLLLGCWIQFLALPLAAAETNDIPRFNVEGYVVHDTIAGSATNFVPMFSEYTGTNVGVEEIVRAAADLQSEYAKRGFPTVSVAVGASEISNGIVTMHVFQSAVPQIRIAGQRYICSSNDVTLFANLLPPAVTNIAETIPPAIPEKPAKPSKPPTPEEEALHQKMAELEIAEREAKFPPQPPPTKQLILAAPMMPVTNDVELALRDKFAELDKDNKRAGFLPRAATNSAPATNGPVFEVRGYEVIGNTLLSSNVVELVLQPYIGTNVTFERIRAALTDLQTVYREHGFATVSVTLPQQTLSDKIVRIRVFEGRLEEITVVNNHYFSSNNVMRALPSLHENMILTAPIFQAELDRANANQDRQIYPAIEPGLLEGTTMLKLDVKDRIPIHAKTEFNNENSPGTPELRVNSSAEFKNLWQLEHSLGVQYSFSPEKFKTGDQWDFYDRPLVANYSGFYRMPLGNPEAVANTIGSSTRFGYDEATRRFNLPPPSGQPELNIYASRSAIDTGLQTTFSTNVLPNEPGVRTIFEHDVQQDITINEDIGFKLSTPLAQFQNWSPVLSAGLDFKTYESTSAKTNNFLFTEYFPQPDGSFIVRHFTLPSGRPLTHHLLEYLPVSVRLDASKPDALGTTFFSLGVAGNVWHSGSASNLLGITGSPKSSGYWATVSPSLTRDFMIPKGWTLSLHAEGQWASEPLISTEQFGSGGVNSVRGYHEGEVFGDTGWRTDAELKTPPHVVGIAYNKQPLTIRGSIFTDYSQTYLIDPVGRNARIPLWGAGAGWVTSIGSHWEARFLFAVPFEKTATTEALRPKFNFSIIGQF